MRSPALAFVVVAWATIAACGREPTRVDSTAQSDSVIRARLGTFSVVPLGLPPGSDSITTLTANDSNVVAGMAAQRPFRWRDGQFTFLATRGATSVDIASLNNRGDLIGKLDGTVVMWPGNDTVPVDVFRADTAVYALEVRTLTDDRDLLFGSNSIVAIVNVDTKVVTKRPVELNSFPVAMNDHGTVVYNEFKAFGYNAWHVSATPSTATIPRCTNAGRSALVHALNDRDDILMTAESAVQQGEHLYRLFGNGACADLTASLGIGIEARFINNLRWVATAQTLSKLIIPDGVIPISALVVPQETWAQIEVKDLTNTGVMLATVRKVGDASGQAVLIVPGKSFTPAAEVP